MRWLETGSTRMGNRVDQVGNRVEVVGDRVELELSDDRRRLKPAAGKAIRDRTE